MSNLVFLNDEGLVGGGGRVGGGLVGALVGAGAGAGCRSLLTAGTATTGCRPRDGGGGGDGDGDRDGDDEGVGEGKKKFLLLFSRDFWARWLDCCTLGTAGMMVNLCGSIIRYAEFVSAETSENSGRNMRRWVSSASTPATFPLCSTVYKHSHCALLSINIPTVQHCLPAARPSWPHQTMLPAVLIAAAVKL